MIHPALWNTGYPLFPIPSLSHLNMRCSIPSAYTSSLARPRPYPDPKSSEHFSSQQQRISKQPAVETGLDFSIMKDKQYSKDPSK